jgi:hypothetical protein
MTVIRRDYLEFLGEYFQDPEALAQIINTPTRLELTPTLSIADFPRSGVVGGPRSLEVSLALRRVLLRWFVGPMLSSAGTSSTGVIRELVEHLVPSPVPRQTESVGCLGPPIVVTLGTPLWTSLPLRLRAACATQSAA